MKRWLALLLLPLLASCGYNTIQRLDEQANNAQGQIEVQLQRRVNLIPNLVNTVKGYATHEQETLDEITRARSGLQSALQTRDPTAMANADAQLTGALSRLNINIEAYPNLKADQLFIRLQDELAGTENRIATARTDYNQAVNQYNAYIRQFPAVLTAKVTGARERKYFTADASAQQGPPTVDFSKPAAAPPAKP
jgi:LemA protein